MKRRKVSAERAAFEAEQLHNPGPARLAYLKSWERERADLPWRSSYSNWTYHLGCAAARHNARIAYGAETYAAWEAGISPDDYAAERAGSAFTPRS